MSLIAIWICGFSTILPADALPQESLLDQNATSHQLPAIDSAKLIRTIHFATDRVIENSSSLQYSVEDAAISIAMLIFSIIFCGHVIFGALRHWRRFQLTIAGTTALLSIISLLTHSSHGKAAVMRHGMRLGAYGGAFVRGRCNFELMPLASDHVKLTSAANQRAVQSRKNSRDDSNAD